MGGRRFCPASSSKHRYAPVTALTPEVALTVPPPDPRAVDAPGVARDRHSIVMIESAQTWPLPAT